MKKQTIDEVIDGMVSGLHWRPNRPGLPSREPIEVPPGLIAAWFEANVADPGDLILVHEFDAMVREYRDREPSVYAELSPVSGEIVNGFDLVCGECGHPGSAHGTDPDGMGVCDHDGGRCDCGTRWGR